MSWRAQWRNEFGSATVSGRSCSRRRLRRYADDEPDGRMRATRELFQHANRMYSMNIGLAVRQSIYILRGQRIMLSTDLAEL